MGRVRRVGIKSCGALPNPPHSPTTPQPSDRFLLAGVMGWPVMRSRSPVLHNYFFNHYALRGTYVPLAIKPDDLEPALRALVPLGFAGCNLTIPHKERALAIVDEIDDLAGRIGAISCVDVRPDGSLAGTNNDVHGFAAPATWPFSRNALRYFSTAIAAVVASPTAVVIWRVTWLRTSPAANRPVIDVIMRLSVIR